MDASKQNYRIVPLDASIRLGFAVRAPAFSPLRKLIRFVSKDKVVPAVVVTVYGEATKAAA